MSMKCLLFGCEVRGENASSWLGFSSRSKIDSCIQRRKGERSWGACRVSPQPPPRPPRPPFCYAKLSTAPSSGCFLLRRPFSSDSAKLFAFVGPVCRPFSHLSPPVRFTARPGRVWPVNLWWLKCLPVVSGTEHVEHQKLVERLNIVPFISRELWRKRERSSRMCNRFILQIKGGSCWEGHTFSHTSLWATLGLTELSVDRLIKLHGCCCCFSNSNLVTISCISQVSILVSVTLKQPEKRRSALRFD